MIPRNDMKQIIKVGFTDDKGFKSTTLTQKYIKLLKAKKFSQIICLKVIFFGMSISHHPAYHFVKYNAQQEQAFSIDLNK